MTLKTLPHLLLAAVLLATSVAPALAADAAEPVLSVQGPTVEGKPFNLASLKGKVVLLMFWSTDCAVCRDKMPELRMNYEGWKNQPFELVTVSVDRRKQDLDEYERLIAHLVPAQQRFVQIWRGEPQYKDNIGTPARLPMSFLIDKEGRTVQRYSGRIPAEAWDQIADLL